MPGFLMHVGAVGACPHGGQVQVVPTGTRVLVNGQPVATAGDTYPIAGCTFNVSGAPHPCVQVLWSVPALRVLIGGQPAILATSGGIGQSADLSPQGPVILTTQQRVTGT